MAVTGKQVFDALLAFDAALIGKVRTVPEQLEAMRQALEKAEASKSRPFVLSFDDMGFGVTDQSRHHILTRLERPEGLNNREWYAHAGDVLEKLGVRE